MAKTILLPVDLQVPSLVTLKHAMEQCHPEPVEVHLLYAEELSGSITDMLFYSPGKLLKDVAGSPFGEALEIIKNRYPDSITKLRFQLLHFNSLSYLQRVIGKLGVTHVYVPASYKLQCRGRAFDPVPLLKKTELPVHSIPFEIAVSKSDQVHILSLFN